MGILVDTTSGKYTNSSGHTNRKSSEQSSGHGNGHTSGYSSVQIVVGIEVGIVVGMEVGIDRGSITEVSRGRHGQTISAPQFTLMSCNNLYGPLLLC